MNENMMSQEEVEKMLKEAGQLEGDGNELVAKDAGSAFNVDEYLSKQERDVLGEIGNICMGTAATTMNTLLNRSVHITTPRVAIHNMQTLSDEYTRPILVVEVNYMDGVIGKNLLILKEYDVAVMTDILMGGEGTVDAENILLDEMHISAIREVMNQMVGSSATSLSNLLTVPINISPPRASHINLQSDDLDHIFDENEILVKISFKMEIEGLLTSEIMQVLPIDFAKQLVDKLLGLQSEQKEEPPVAIDEKPKEEEKVQVEKTAPQKQEQPASETKQQPAKENAAIPTPQPQSYGKAVKNPNEVDAKDVAFPSFDTKTQAAVEGENIGMLSGVPMQVTVELGKSKKTIKEILEFNAGSVVVLDKLAGEPVDVLVNGRPIAKGEVVVVDDNYGVRITEINTRAITEE